MFVALPETVKMSCIRFIVPFLNIETVKNLLLSDKLMMLKYFRKLHFSN